MGKKENQSLSDNSRRSFIKHTTRAAIAFTIIPRYVLGGKGFIAPSDQINIGFIGTGKQSRDLLNSFFEKAQIVAGSDVDFNKLELFRTRTEKAYANMKGLSSYKGFKGYKDFRNLLERKDIDGIIVATPDHWHAIASIMAALAGKHVYCEKPLAHTVMQGRAMVNAINENHLVLQTGSMQRSWKNFRHACELIRNGYIGKISEVLVSVGDPAIPCDLAGEPLPENLDWTRWLGPNPYRPYNSILSPPVEQDIYPMWRKYSEYGGGILSDWGAHMFDIAQWALDMDRSGPLKFIPPDGKEHSTLTMIYANGVVMKHENFGRGYGVRFIGEKGKIDISRDYLDSNPSNIVNAVIQPGEVQLYHSDDHYQNWLDGIKTGRQPICDAETGHRTSSVCAIANIAYKLRRPLTWDPELEKFKDDAEANELLKGPVKYPDNLI